MFHCPCIDHDALSQSMSHRKIVAPESQNWYSSVPERLIMKLAAQGSFEALIAFLESLRLQALLLLQYERAVITAVGMRGIFRVLPVLFYSKV